jgi:E3 ubiquitin-protein ligase SHPRH
VKCGTVPVAHSALAIGRVDRLGQRNETSVYCYATRETVESRILSQGVRNGTSIYLKDAEGGDVSNDSDQEDLLKLIL